MTHSLDGITLPIDVPTTVRMRASDADRHACVQLLQDAVARGLLTPTEGSERMGGAFAAVHRADLVPLTADLPPAPVDSGPAAPIGARLTMLDERLRSFLQSGDGRSRAAQLVAVMVLLVLLLAVGTAMLHLLLDGGGGPERGGGFGGRR